MRDLRLRLLDAADPPSTSTTTPDELRRLGMRRRRTRWLTSTLSAAFALVLLVGVVLALNDRQADTTIRFTDDPPVQIPPTAVPTDLSGIIIGGVAEVPHGLVATGQRPTPQPSPSGDTAVALFSPDGRRWYETLEVPGAVLIGPAPGAGDVLITSLEFTPDADFEESGPLPHRQARVWRSADGLQWEQLATTGLDGDVAFTSVVWSGEEYLAVGQPSPVGTESVAVPISTYHSTEGRIWRRGAGLPIAADLTTVAPQAAVSPRTGVVIAADPQGMAEPQVYVGDPGLRNLSSGPQLEGDTGQVSWVRDRFIAVAQRLRDDTYSTFVLSSVDGRVWSEQPLWQDRPIDENDLVAVGGLDGSLVAVVTPAPAVTDGAVPDEDGRAAYVLVSDDGVVWEHQDIVTPAG